MMLATLVLAAIAWTDADTSDRPVLLDFHASWCSPCRQMRPELERLRDLEIPIRSIDIDQDRETALKYNVTQVPTFVVVNREGRELSRSVGYQPAERLVDTYESVASQPSNPPSSETEGVNPRPWETVVRIKVHNPPQSVGFGSGTVVYATDEEALILTCAHIFQIENARQQPNPKRFPRRVTVDLFDGRLTGPKNNTVRPRETNLPAEVMDYDFAADVGLIRIRPGRRLPAARVVPANWAPQQGQRMTTVGCSHGNDATAWTTHVTNPKLRGAVGGSGYEATECEHAPMQGRSGGGLFTQDGFVAGVCDFAEPQGNRGLYASPRSIHRLLDRNQLAFVYAPIRGRDTGNTQLASRRTPNNPTRDERDDDVVYRSQDPNAKPITMPRPELLGVRSPGAADTSGRDNWRKPISPPASSSEDTAFALEERSPKRTREANLALSPSAIGDPFATQPPLATDPSVPPARSTTVRPRTATAGAWKASTSTDR
jgi:thiol-disulfide isomerase/thioredoxin